MSHRSSTPSKLNSAVAATIIESRVIVCGDLAKVSLEQTKPLTPFVLTPALVMSLKQSADDDLLPEGKRVKLADNYTLDFPSLSHTPSHTPAFQRPSQLLTFSYSPSHVLQFDDSALRYFVDPPRGADLNHGYANWTRRPEERGRIDSLLSAWSRFNKSIQGQSPRIGVISWRGVMTK